MRHLVDQRDTTATYENNNHVINATAFINKTINKKLYFSRRYDPVLSNLGLFSINALFSASQISEMLINLCHFSENHSIIII